MALINDKRKSSQIFCQFVDAAYLQEERYIQATGHDILEADVYTIKSHMLGYVKAVSLCGISKST